MLKVDEILNIKEAAKGLKLNLRTTDGLFTRRSHSVLKLSGIGDPSQLVWTNG
jgi:hypothetical protein